MTGSVATEAWPRPDSITDGGLYAGGGARFEISVTSASRPNQLKRASSLYLGFEAAYLLTEIEDIVSAIELEANQAAKPLDWVITNSERQGRLWRVYVEPCGRNAQLDESLEGAAAWWPGPMSGSADVLSVVPEDLQINLRFATSEVPGQGRINVYPIRFLDKLAAAWSSPIRGPKFYRALEELTANVPARLFESPSSHGFGELRAAQRDSFHLLRYRFSFLWGPPGTGKTYTLGAMLASFLVEHPSARVLLLSTTNTAVDLALVSVDEALERLAKTEPKAGICRQECKRVGAHFVAHHYRTRQHLLPRVNDALIQRLAELEAGRPDAADIVKYEAWKSELEELRHHMRVDAKAVFLSSRLAALTCTRGVFSYSDLEDVGPFDLVVFDEASQVGISHAVPFISLAKRMLFAGDPRQIKPIAMADNAGVTKWLGRSPFEFMRADQANTSILTEQSRMIGDICRVVSETFYEGTLKVCRKAEDDPIWRVARRLTSLPLLADEPVFCLDVDGDGRYHPSFRGFVRNESADLIVRGVQAAIAEADPSRVAVLTPFRAQRTVIRNKLRNAGVKGVQVSTVHRAQGSERRIVFFDPVLGTHKAVTDHLINVALSRAQARLVVALSEGDLANPTLRRVKALIDL